LKILKARDFRFASRLSRYKIYSMKTLQELLDDGKSYTEIATILGLTSANATKLCQQEKMRRGEILGHIDPEWAHHRAIDDGAPIETIAQEMGCSVTYARQYLQAHGIFRDAGTVFRSGAKSKPGKGKRVSGSKRDLASKKPKFGSPECREKMAAAKRGKKGADANHWKGGVWIAGDYVMTSVNGRKVYVHRVVAEQLLCRPLTTDEEVHHVDMSRRNNDPFNLIVLVGSDHTRLHRAMSADPNLDQRAWLSLNQIKYEDLSYYAEDRIKETC
jgi:hypothetical protein